MKINSNVPIFIILTLFIASNALLYTYLNNDYFIDKKPTVKEREIPNIIFKLIADHEKILNERNAEILRQAEELRNRRATVTDSAELKAIEEKLRALEAASRDVEEKVKLSESERKIAEQQSKNDQLQLTELMAANNAMGVELDLISTEYENYVSTIKGAITQKNESEESLLEINSAFNKNNGLEYVTNLITNIQEDKSSQKRDFLNYLLDRSKIYNDGFTTLTTEMSNPNYLSDYDNDGIIVPDTSLDKVINSFLKFKTQKNSEITNLREALKQQAENNTLSQEEKDRLLEEQLAQLEEEKNQELAAQAELYEAENKKNMEDFQKKLQEEMAAKAALEIKNSSSADELYSTDWIYIPGFWSSEDKSLSYSGKRVETLAWSRENITDDTIITFDGDFDKNGELLMVLYGNGKFKSWKDGYILSLKKNSAFKGQLTILKKELGENREILLEQEVSLPDNLNGFYYIKINKGNLFISINDKVILESFILSGSLNGRIGIGNRETSKYPFNINNIRLFKIL